MEIMTHRQMDQPRLELRGLTYKLRPSRNAILVPPDVAWDGIDRIIQGLCWYWGGPLSLIIPCNGSEIEPLFWEHLRSYDPDYLYSPLAVDVFDADLLDRLRMRLCPFEAFDRIILRCDYEWLRLHSSIELPVLFTDMPDIDEPLIIWSLQGLPAYLAVCFHDDTGHLSQDRIQQLQHPTDVRWQLGADQDLVKVPVEKRQVDGESVFSLLSSIRRRSHVTPRGMATWALAHIAYDNAGMPLVGGRPLEAPAVVIIGDTVRDYCLAHNLRSLTQEAYWLPGLPQDATDGEEAVLEAILDDLVDRLLHPTSQYKCERILVYSASKPNEQLQASRDEIASRIARRQIRVFRGDPDIGKQDASPSSEHTPVDVAENSSELLTYHLEYIEANNFGRSLSQFYGGRAVSELNTPLPKNFDKHCFSYRYNWIVEVEIEGYRLPRRFDLVEGHLPEHPRSLARLADRGIAYSVMPIFIPGGYDLSSLAARPELRLLHGQDIFRRVFDKAGLLVGLSDKGKYFTQALDRFGSVIELSHFLLRSEHQRLLAQYRDTTTRPGKATTDQGIILNDRRYLNLEAMITALGIVEDERHTEATYALLGDVLEEWIGRSLLRRGLALKCRHCDYSDWYPVDSLSEQFTCRRCGTTEKWNVEHLHRLEGHPPEPPWFYQLDEAFFQFVHHNGFVTAVTLARLDEESSSGLIYLPEVRYWPQGRKARRHTPELDFVAIAAGKLVLGECKTSVQDISGDTRKQLKRDARLAKQLSADGFVLGTVEPFSERCLAKVRRVFAEQVDMAEFKLETMSEEALHWLL